jgi:NADP-dependent 3-hydroxy acid dehydrogenase YdfG
MDLGLKGKTVLVTGASQGIGEGVRAAVPPKAAISISSPGLPTV